MATREKTSRRTFTKLDHDLQDRLYQLPVRAMRPVLELMRLSDWRSGQCTISIERLAERCRQSRRTTEMAIRDAVEAGLLVVRRGQRASTYQVLRDGDARPAETGASVDPDAQKRASRCAKTDVPDAQGIAHQKSKKSATSPEHKGDSGKPQPTLSDDSFSDSLSDKQQQQDTPTDVPAQGAQAAPTADVVVAFSPGGKGDHGRDPDRQAAHKAMRDFGVSALCAKRYAFGSDYTPADIDQARRAAQADIDRRQAKGETVRNPAGVFVKALTEGWDVPQGRDPYALSAERVAEIERLEAQLVEAWADGPGPCYVSATTVKHLAREHPQKAECVKANVAADALARLQERHGIGVDTAAKLIERHGPFAVHAWLHNTRTAAGSAACRELDTLAGEAGELRRRERYKREREKRERIEATAGRK